MLREGGVEWRVHHIESLDTSFEVGFSLRNCSLLPLICRIYHKIWWYGMQHSGFRLDSCICPFFISGTFIYAACQFSSFLWGVLILMPTLQKKRLSFDRVFPRRSESVKLSASAFINSFRLLLSLHDAKVHRAVKFTVITFPSAPIFTFLAYWSRKVQLLRIR